MKRTVFLLAAVMTVGTWATPAEVSADDALRLRGTPAEKHAQQVYVGVFGQCRPSQPSELNGTIGLVFEVKPSGRFSATSTFRESAGRDAIRELTQCMGTRANMAGWFPKSKATQIVGVKYEVRKEGDVLMLGSGAADTLDERDVFTWARQPVGGAGT